VQAVIDKKPKNKKTMAIFDKIFGKKNENYSIENITAIPESWSVLSGDNDGNPMLIRKNTGLNKIAGNRNYSMSCGIAFKLLFPDGNGLPNIEKEPELDNLEDDIFEMYETDLNSIIATIITTSGFREFVLYSKDVKEFNLRLEELRIKYPQYGITSYYKKDENWETYKSFK
jgi:Family of unknown function (DUF695)